MSNDDLAGSCQNCGARWTYTVKGWLIVDRSGRLDLRELVPGAKEKPPPYRRCPKCGVPLSAGKARVEEVTE